MSSGGALSFRISISSITHTFYVLWFPLLWNGHVCLGLSSPLWPWWQYCRVWGSVQSGQTSCNRGSDHLVLMEHKQWPVLISDQVTVDSSRASFQERLGLAILINSLSLPAPQYNLRWCWKKIASKSTGLFFKLPALNPSWTALAMAFVPDTTRCALGSQGFSSVVLSFSSFLWCKTLN